MFVQHEQSVVDHGCSKSHTLRPGCVTTTFLKKKQKIVFFFVQRSITHEALVVEL